MNNIRPRHDTGNETADQILRGIVGIFETAFPGQISSYFLAGSHAYGAALPHSDIDLHIIFKKSIEAEDYQKFWDLHRHCRLLCPVELDFKPFCVSQLKRLGYPELHDSCALIYGEDFRDEVPRVTEEIQRILILGSAGYQSRIRGNPDQLRLPLNFPDPDDTFFGYARKKLREPNGAKIHSTKDIINCTVRPAISLLAMKNSSYVSTKRECVIHYRQTIGDEWTELLEEVEKRCRVAWAYRVPDDATERETLRRLCQRILAFENHFMRRYRDFLLEELAREDGSETRLSPPDVIWLLGAPEPLLGELYERGALRVEAVADEYLLATRQIHKVGAALALMRFIFGDREIAAALEKLGSHEDPLLAALANRALAAQTGPTPSS